MADFTKPEEPASGTDETADVFYRVKRSSSILGFFALVFAFGLSVIFLLIGIVGVLQGEYLAVVFGISGAVVLVICFRGAWMMATGPMIHVIAFEGDQIIWGYTGREKVLPVSEVASIRWSIDTDNELHVSVRKNDGKRLSFEYIDVLVSRKDRPYLLAFLKNRYSSIPLEESDNS